MMLDASLLVRHWHQLVARHEDPSILIDGQGRLAAVSRSFAAVLDRDPQEMIGQPALSFVHPDEQSRVQADWDHRRSQGTGPVGVESRWCRRGGGARWLSWYAMGETDHVYLVASDITERKRRELLLRETASVARIGGWELDLVTRELYWSPETYRLHDTTPQEYTPTVADGLRFYVDDSRQRVDAALERLITDGTAFDLQLELVTAKGRIIQCRAKGQAVIEGGRPVRVHGVFQDISEEFKVEQALRDSEELRLSILQDMRAGLVAQRADGTIFMSNPAALEILGLSEDEITGRTSVDERWYAIREDGSPFPGQDHPAMVSLRTGESVTGVIMGVFRPRTQDRAWILIDSVVQRNARGEIARVLSSFIDVTERKRAEDAARKSDAMFRAVFDNAGLGILIRDTGTSQLRANPTFLRMVGRTQQQLRSLSVADLVHPEDSGAADQAHAELLDGRVDSYELERRFCTGDGEQRWGHETVSLVRDDDGTPRYVVEMIVDVTDRKRMETQLMLADRMASLGTMAAGVGHELNNPLTWITGNISLALESLREHPNPTAESRQEILRSLEEAAVGASRVSAIVRDLQIFSRVDDDPEATTEPNLVVESTTRMLRNELKYRATLELDLAPVPEVLGDSARISQILTNLLVNALHALPDRPINDNHIRVRTRTDGDHVVLSVQDNGTGIPDGVRSRIFDPFFTTKAVGTGTGLGLSICHSLVARLGGRIELDTELGQGSVFRVLLVPAASRRTSKLADHAATAARARKRILCIDDEPIVGRLISRVLSNSHDVVVETSAEDALRRLSRGENYDAIICDLMMPNASGIDFFEKLQIVAPALSESCGFITGGAFTPRARSFTETLPPARLLHKPFRPQAVVEFVDELLGRTSPR